MVSDVVAARIGDSFRTHKAGADVATGRLGLGGPKIVVAKLHCFMNVSGGPTAALVRFFGITADQLIVVHDDMDIPFGTIRLKQGGGEGGHNGLRSISASLGTKNYVRARIGVGRPPGRMDPASYVLRDFAAAERPELAVVLEEACEAIEMIATEGLITAQNTVNAR